MADNPFDLPDGYGGVARSAVPELPLAPTFAAPEGGHDKLLEGPSFAEHVAVPPPSPWPRRRLWAKRAGVVLAVAMLLLIAALAIFAPVSRTLQPTVPPQITLAYADGRPFARMGAIVDRRVEIARLPPHVIQAFTAIEDRRFYDHWGVDPRGIARALWSNVRVGSARQGGSTISQQLAKVTYLSNDRTFARKLKELPIALWLEAWLSKDEILERYLSNVYFGDNVYGLRAASLHYFYRQPERLTLSQAAMLAGLMKAPSRLAPTRNIEGARARERLVLAAMADAGYLTPAEARATKSARVDHRPPPSLPAGGYFADWALGEARAATDESYAAAKVTTTLDRRLQRIAERVTRGAGPNGAQVALVAMRPDGAVVAMVGGKDHAASPFNRATQARRQPGSTFKLVVYYAALQAGFTLDTLVDDSPIETGDYRPANSGKRYRGRITLREAFARSSNVVAVRLYQQLGAEKIAAAARKLGLPDDLPANASVALGTSGVTLTELTSAYAAIAAGESPIEPHALARPEQGFVESLFDRRHDLPSRTRAELRTMLAAVVREGTGTGARLAIPAYGKTGTTQNGRDAWFVGFAGDLVVGVWIGHDDNRPLGVGSASAVRIWRNFMVDAIPGAAPRIAPKPVPPVSDVPLPDVILPPEITIDPETGIGVETGIGDARIRIDRDGLRIGTPPEPPPTPAPVPPPTNESAAAPPRP